MTKLKLIKKKEIWKKYQRNTRENPKLVYTYVNSKIKNKVGISKLMVEVEEINKKQREIMNKR